MNYFDKIKEALSSKLKGQELTLDSNLRDLGIDSLDVVDLIMDLEEELGIEFSDEELMSIHTMKDVCDLIDKRRHKKIQTPVWIFLCFVFK